MDEKSIGPEIPNLPVYPHGINPIDMSQQKPIMKIMGRMLASRLKLPHSKVLSQSVKIKHKKITYW